MGHLSLIFKYVCVSLVGVSKWLVHIDVADDVVATLC